MYTVPSMTVTSRNLWRPPSEYKHHSSRIFTVALRKLTVGDPSDKNNKLGALISKEHLTKVHWLLTGIVIHMVNSYIGDTLCGASREGRSNNCLRSWQRTTNTTREKQKCKTVPLCPTS